MGPKSTIENPQHTELAQVSSSFLEAAYSHASEHEQHALEEVQRIRFYSEKYVEPAPPAQDARDTAARRDPGIQTSFLDQARHHDH